jgi:hypothetical protein
MCSRSCRRFFRSTPRSSKDSGNDGSSPDDLLALANVVVDSKGVHRREATAASTAKPVAGPLSKRWRLHLVQLNDTLDVEEAERGVRKGLEDAGLVEGRDYETMVRNAQGDMATVSGLIDAALTDRADLIITFSTPTLQAALQRAKSVPVVFNYVADAVAAGAGTSDTSHLPNVTGVYLLGAYAECCPSSGPSNRRHASSAPSTCRPRSTW